MQRRIRLRPPVLAENDKSSHICVMVIIGDIDMVWLTLPRDLFSGFMCGFYS